MDLEGKLIITLEETDNLIKKNKRLLKEIIFIKTEKEIEKRVEEVLNNNIKEKEEKCEKLE